MATTRALVCARQLKELRALDLGPAAEVALAIVERSLEDFSESTVAVVRRDALRTARAALKDVTRMAEAKRDREAMADAGVDGHRLEDVRRFHAMMIDRISNLAEFQALAANTPVDPDAAAAYQRELEQRHSVVTTRSIDARLAAFPAVQDVYRTARETSLAYELLITSDNPHSRRWLVERGLPLPEATV